MGIKALEFWVSLDEMREEGLPETFDYFRFQKGGNEYPFICVHTDAAFLEMLSLENIMWPEEIEFDAAAWKIVNKMPGVYQKIPTNAKEILDESGGSLDENVQPLKNGKEAFLDHLEKMKAQTINYGMEEKDFRLLVSRNYLQQQHSFTYNENLDFSVLKLIVALNPDFPQKWNLNCLPGPLKDICSENESFEVIGVSSSMTYGGKRGSYTALHVEDLDYASANVQFPWSAGKAWFAIHPEDQHILDDYVRTNGFRTKCPTPFLHKDIILDLDLLDRLAIRWYFFIQRPGDIILTNPAAPHQVVNLGFNLAESTNFYSLRHLVTARRRIACACPTRLKQYKNEAWNRLATFVYSGEFRFLCKVNGLAVPDPEEILTQILKEAEEFNESFSSGQALANPNDVVTMADILQKFTQDLHLQKPSEENCEAEDTVSLPTASCVILSTSPLDLASLTQPCDTIVDPCEEEPRPSTTPPPSEEEPRPPPTEPRPSTTPPPSEEEPRPPPSEPRPPPTEPRPSTTPPPSEEEPRPPPTEPRPSTTPPPREDSFDLFETPERTPSPRGRKRPPSPRLFEDPDAKAQRLNARADFFSQRRHYRGPPNTSYARASSPALSLASSPAYSPPPSAAQSTSSTVPAPSAIDPRVTQASKIRKNTKEYKNKNESRQRARQTYEEKNPGRKPRKLKPASAWFTGYIRSATRRIKTAEGKIAHYASRVTVPSCDWNAKLQSATTIKSHLEHRRFLYNVLQKMYQYCPDDLKERLDEGYLEQEIFRDFINFHSAANMELLRATLESYNADFNHWENVLTNEEAWNAEFGIDSRYRIPCVEFSKLKFNVLDLL